MTIKAQFDRTTRGPRAFVAAFLLCGAIIVPVGLVVNHADGATRPNICQLENPERPCWATPPKLAHRVKSGVTHTTSDAFRFPTRIRRMAIRAHQHAVQRGDIPAFQASPDCITCGWWSTFTGFESCVTLRSVPWSCSAVHAGDQGQHFRQVAHVIEPAERITVLCGGLSILGSLKGGGWWGAGIGAGGCFWSQWLATW